MWHFKVLVNTGLDSPMHHPLDIGRSWYRFVFGLVAQLAEQWTLNPAVESSILSGPTKSSVLDQTALDLSPVLWYPGLRVKIKTGVLSWQKKVTAN